MFKPKHEPKIHDTIKIIKATLRDGRDADTTTNCGKVVGKEFVITESDFGSISGSWYYVVRDCDHGRLHFYRDEFIITKKGEENASISS